MKLSNTDAGLLIFGLFVLFILSLIFAVVSWMRRRLLVRRLNRKKEEDRERAGRRKISQKDKEYILERDNYTCQICGISKQFFDDMCPGAGDYLLLEIDHIKSVANGGRGDDLDNLQTLCWRCNRKKGGKKTNQDLIGKIDYGIDYLE